MTDGGVELDRDVVVGSTAAQRVPPGGAVVDCRDCGAKMLLDNRQIAELGKRRTAVAICDLCEGKAKLAQGPGGPAADLPQVLREAIAHLAANDPADVRTHFEFDPPSAGDAVQSTMRLSGGGTVGWRWRNDTGIPVLVIRKSDGDARLIPNGDELTMAAAATPGFPPTRPVRDDPRA